MATPLDISLLQQFSGVFPFLFVLVLIYAVLQMTDMFKEKKGLSGAIAFITAIMTLLSGVAIKTINLMAPWFVLFMIFGVLMILAYMAFGISKEKILEILTGSEYGGTSSTWVIAIMLIIGLGSLFTVINEERGFPLSEEAGVAEAQPPGETGFWETLFHPKILGMVLVLLIAFFTLGKLASYS